MLIINLEESRVVQHNRPRKHPSYPSVSCSLRGFENLLTKNVMAISN